MVARNVVAANATVVLINGVCPAPFGVAHFMNITSAIMQYNKDNNLISLNRSGNVRLTTQPLMALVAYVGYSHLVASCRGTLTP
ncbi:MAG: hypothetical protein UX68_C0026G0009 [Parcubacteria group bacterium GW2011_GWA2_46_9]|nr:MAG: hypothetical protein UX68_C0026G0009 [Parcubacteria group bacterium GW2011_GWA2_46_9]